MVDRYRAELQDICLYSPHSLPAMKDCRFVGRPVHVVWQQPIFTFAGGKPGKGLIHELTQWFGYVIELDRQVPQDELLPQRNKTTSARKDA